MFESWPHHGDMISVVCLVSENHPKHGQKSYKIIIEDDLGLLGGLGVKNKSSVGSGLANSSFAFLSEILGSEKSSLVCHLWRAYHATSLCLVCLSDVRCTSSAAIAPGQMDMFFGDQTGIDIPRKCMFFSACSFFKCLSLCCALDDGNKDWRSPQECAGEGWCAWAHSFGAWREVMLCYLDSQDCGFA